MVFELIVNFQELTHPKTEKETHDVEDQNISRNKSFRLSKPLRVGKTPIEDGNLRAGGSVSENIKLSKWYLIF